MISNDPIIGVVAVDTGGTLEVADTTVTMDVTAGISLYGFADWSKRGMMVAAGQKGLVREEFFVALYNSGSE